MQGDSEDAGGQEGISKNALKKQQKAEEAAKKKAAKEQEKVQKSQSEPAPLKKAGVVAEDAAEELDPTQYYENRLRAIASLEVS
jgi:lysyl-tRNA synthetase class 2